MEINCVRCNQAVETDSCYCATCGLPQLQYSAENVPGQAPPERWNEPIRDASMVDWKRALPTVLMLGIAAGLLSSEVSPMGRLGLFWMSSAAALAVALYLRSQRPAWITVGAGARIGLVTGLLGAWIAFSANGGALFVQRVVLHHGSQIDADWMNNISAGEQLSKQMFESMGPMFAAQEEAAEAQNRTWMLSSEGHAGGQASNLAIASCFLLLFAIAGGALGARFQARTRRPQV
jgi:hypothetical protein